MAIRHLVLLNFKDDLSPATRTELETAFVALSLQIDGITAFDWGINHSVEGLGKGFTHVFNFTFVDAPARDAYMVHPAHLAFVAQLQPCLDDVIVLDYDL